MTESVPIHGVCDRRFVRVREEFARGFGEFAGDAERGEIGAAVAATVGGRLVLDLWAGCADPARRRPWRRDTLANVYSTSKGIVAIAALRLVEEGRLRLEAPVARYWPEFAGHGRDAVRVGMLLSHRSGLAALRRPLAPDAIYDWAGMISALAVEEPWWRPDEKHGYHAFTYGWLVGELIRRASGLKPGRYLREALAGPLGLDLHLGLEAACEERAAELTSLPFGAPDSEQAALIARIRGDPQSVSAKAFTNPPTLLAPGVVNSRAWRRAEIPAANAHTTARALARLYAVLAVGGELDGVRVLGAEGLAGCCAEQSSGFDEVLRIPTRFSLGFMLSQPHARFGRGARAFGHPGAGGSLGFADPDAAVSFGYVTNRLGPYLLLDPRPAALVDALYGCL